MGGVSGAAGKREGPGALPPPGSSTPLSKATEGTKQSAKEGMERLPTEEERLSSEGLEAKTVTKKKGSFSAKKIAERFLGSSSSETRPLPSIPSYIKSQLDRFLDGASSHKGKQPAASELGDQKSLERSSRVQAFHEQIAAKEEAIFQKEKEIREQYNLIERNNSIIDRQQERLEDPKANKERIDSYIAEVQENTLEISAQLEAMEKEIESLRGEQTQLKLMSAAFRLEMALAKNDQIEADLTVLSQQKERVEQKIAGQLKRLGTLKNTPKDDEKGKIIMEELASLREELDTIESKTAIIKSNQETHGQLKALHEELQELKGAFAKDRNDLSLDLRLDELIDKTIWSPEGKEKLQPVEEGELQALKEAYGKEPKNGIVRHQLALALLSRGELPERKSSIVSEAEEELLGEMAKILTENPHFGAVRKIGQGAGASYFLGIEQEGNFKPMFVVKPFDEQPGGPNYIGEEASDLVKMRERYYGGPRGELVRDYVRLNGPFNDTMGSIARLQHNAFVYRNGLVIPKECLVIRYEPNECSMEGLTLLEGRNYTEEQRADILAKREEYQLKENEGPEAIFAKSSKKAELTLERFIFGDVGKRGEDSNIGNFLIVGREELEGETLISDYRMIDGGSSSADSNTGPNKVPNPPAWQFYRKADLTDEPWHPETRAFVEGYDIDKQLERDAALFAKQGVHYTSNARRLDKQAFRLARATMLSQEAPVSLRRIGIYVTGEHFEREAEALSNVKDRSLPQQIAKLAEDKARFPQ